MHPILRRPRMNKIGVEQISILSKEARGRRGPSRIQVCLVGKMLWLSAASNGQVLAWVLSTEDMRNIVSNK